MQTLKVVVMQDCALRPSKMGQLTSCSYSSATLTVKGTDASGFKSKCW